jgi:sulfoxide reductase heme-binding subunit YedZ
LAYAASALAVVHFFIQSKADVTEAFVMGGLFAWLMGWRLLARYQLTRPGLRGIVALVALTFLAAAAAALAEAIYYHLKTGVEIGRVMATNLSIGIGVRPSWVVGGGGLAIALGALLRPLWAAPSGRGKAGAS